MLTKAIIYAAKAHSGMFRKHTETPYIVHPMEAAAIVASMTDDTELIAAAMLHDTVEDVKDISIDDIRFEFGERIAALVAAETEKKETDAKGSWQRRKQTTLDFLNNNATIDEKIVTLGDKLSNMRSIARDYKQIGDNLWQRFNQSDKNMQGWYYKGLLEALKDLSVYSAYDEYKKLVNQVFGN